MSKYRVHHLKNYQPKPEAIHCIEYDERNNRLAVSRSNNNIEIWNFFGVPFKEKVIIGNKDESVEALAWCNGRLFSTGLHGYILEYDLVRCCVKYREPIFSGPAWCLALNHQMNRLAVGTENGHICLFDILEDKIKFEKVLDKQENRTLCISWHKSDAFIVTGSLDVIQIWAVRSGRIIMRMATGRLEQKQENIVWCVQFLQDHTVVSGDSRGKVCFWDSKTGSLLESFQTHKADVLSMAIDEYEEQVFCSGIDPSIVVLSRVHDHHDSSYRKIRWVKAHPRNIHTHDVRSLVFTPRFLISGGVDSCLTFSRHQPRIAWKYHQAAQSDNVKVASNARCVLLKYNTYIEVWKLGHTDKQTGDRAEILPLESNMIKLLELHSKGEEDIVCCAISEHASWIAFSTTDRLKLYQLSIVDINEAQPKVTLSPVLSLPSECKSAHKLAFTPDSKRLIVASSNLEVQVLSLDVLQPTLLHTFSSFHNSIYLLKVSKDGKLVAAASCDSVIQIFNLDSFTVHCALPRIMCSPTAMEFNPEGSNLIVVHSDFQIIEFDLETKEYTDWSRKNTMMQFSKWTNQLHAITNVFFNSTCKDAIYFQSDDLLFVVDKSKINDLESYSPTKYKRRDSGDHKSSTRKMLNYYSYTQRYKHLIYFGSVEEDEVIAVEMKPNVIFDKLPSALRQKKFGT